LQKVKSLLKDPRVTGRTEHRLLDILVITICAVLIDAESWVDVEMSGKVKKVGVAAKRKLAGWSNEFLLKVVLE
jgi:hypothetical protein